MPPTLAWRDPPREFFLGNKLNKGMKKVRGVKAPALLFLCGLMRESPHGADRVIGGRRSCTLRLGP